MSLRIILAASLVLLGGSCLGSEAPTSLWEVKSEHTTIHLLGSIHVLSEEDHPLPESMENAFNDAESVVFELDFDKMESDATQNIIMSKALCTQGDTFQSMLSEDTYDFVKTELNELAPGMISQLNFFEPWFVALYISEIKREKLGFKSEYGVDNHFFEKAKDSGKETIAFETVEFQIDLYDQLSGAHQEELILNTMRELDLIEDDLETMIEAWRDGDTSTLEDVVTEGSEDYPNVHAKFVTDRNFMWLSQIEEFLEDEKQYLVVVGAGHMVGPDGLVALLQDKGYSVEQL
ncbi:MAG: TraB/GumN family protein [Chloroflexota bacterium]|nr:TraB/GumN family protein [Chloroflexota bacterium]